MFSKKRALEIIEMAIDIEESEISPEAALDQAMEKESEDGDEMFMGDWGPHLAEEDLDENTTGTGASFSGGKGEGYASPGAFAKNKNEWENSDMIYEYGEEEQPAEPQVDADGNPIEQPAEEEEVVDTATELASQLKSLSSDLKKPAGQKGFDKKEIEMFSHLIISIMDAVRSDNATSLLQKLSNIVK